MYICKEEKDKSRFNQYTRRFCSVQLASIMHLGTIYTYMAIQIIY